MNPNEILLTCTDLIRERGGSYGHYSIMHNRMAARFTTSLDYPVENYQAALLMAELKLARISESPRTNLDSWLDAICYLAIGAALANNDEEGDDLYV